MKKLVYNIVNQNVIYNNYTGYKYRIFRNSEYKNKYYIMELDTFLIYLSL